MPTVSVFTPSHRTIFLDECLASLLAQTFDDWEWIVLLNGGASWTPKVQDERVLISATSEKMGVGAAKRAACVLAKGEYLVELDHDDILTSTALADVVAAFEDNPYVGFVYSNTAQINEDGTRNGVMFNTDMGWRNRDTEVDGRLVLECRAMKPLPSNVSYIWFAPNHVRAFRKDLYEAVGGYNADLGVLDDQDIMCRMYQQTDFFHLDKCLYLQRMHPLNTQSEPETNQHIQRETTRIYDENIQANALAWSKRRGLLALDLGAAHNKPEGFIGVDLYAHPDVEIVGDVTKGIDLPDGSVGVIRASDFIEHIPDKVALFNEFYRLLAHGGILLTLTPSTDGRGAFQDPTHVAYYNENSFWYFTSKDYANFVPEIKCKFQSSRLYTFFPTQFHEEHNISYVVANLVAVKDESGPTIAGYPFEPRTP
jgi:glycosyltransferase involved in cell wall biosynthesis